MRRFFSFPNPVDSAESRLNAMLVTFLVPLACYLVEWRGIPWLWAFIAYGFMARVACGPRLDPSVRGVLIFVYPFLVVVAFPSSTFIAFNHSYISISNCRGTKTCHVVIDWLLVAGNTCFLVHPLKWGGGASTEVEGGLQRGPPWLTLSYFILPKRSLQYRETCPSYANFNASVLGAQRIK